MGFNDPLTWSNGELTAADLNTHLRDNMQYLAGHSSNAKPNGIVTLGTPVALTSADWTYIVPDTVVLNRGGAWSSFFAVPSGAAGLYHFTASVYTAAGQGNKELRIIRNGDTADYCGVQNQYGVATPAVSGLSTSGRFVLAETDQVDVVLYMDDPASFNVTAAIFTWCWEATDL